MGESIRAALRQGPTLQPDGNFFFEFRFPADDPVFAGHFPGRPLLPGVFQIEMTRIAAELAQGCELDVLEICRAKFLRPIVPEEKLQLGLKLVAEKSIITARGALTAVGQPAGDTLLRLCRKD